MHDGLGDGVVRGDLHLLRIAHEVQREALDAFLERRREQQRLPVLRHPVDDALDRRQEAHVEHAVGFIQHQDLDRIELGGAAFEVVEQAAGASHDDVGAATQVVDLRLHAGAAVQRGHVEAQATAVGLEAVGDLHRQFAGGHQHQRTRLARAVGRRGLRQALQQWQAERGGLAGAGLGAAEHVAAVQHQWNGLDLDLGGGFVAGFGQGAQQRGRKPEVFERHVVYFLRCVRKRGATGSKAGGCAECGWPGAFLGTALRAMF